jgi:hypothetical protein
MRQRNVCPSNGSLPSNDEDQHPDLMTTAINETTNTRTESCNTSNDDGDKVYVRGPTTDIVDATTDTEEITKWEEQCGFVLHVMTILLAVFYTVHIIVHFSYPSRPILLPPPMLDPLLVFRPTPWTFVVPLVLIALFFVVPIVYGFINATKVITPERGSSSLSIIQDQYTVIPQLPSPLEQSPQHDSPPYNNSVNKTIVREYIQLYYQNPFEWEKFVNTTTKGGPTNKDIVTNPIVTSADSSSSSSVPTICDIDVADINDWIWWNKDTRT